MIWFEYDLVPKLIQEFSAQSFVLMVLRVHKLDSIMVCSGGALGSD